MGLEAKQVERTGEALGSAIAAAEKQHRRPAGEGALPSTLDLGIGGAGVPMRPAKLRAQTGEQPQGTAKTGEVKLCPVWSAESRAAANRAVLPGLLGTPS